MVPEDILKIVDEKIYKKLLGNFELLCEIIHQPGKLELTVDLSKVEEIINKSLPDTLGKNAPDDFYNLYVDFKSEYEKFRDFILYEKLIGKNIVALGGGFSSGKSSFLNSLMGPKVLPSDIDPCTSVPTYIVKGQANEVMGINVFKSRVSMQLKDIKKIAHGFGKLEDDEDEIVKEVTLGHVLENIFVSTPLLPYANIAFLDTPGYSNPDSDQYSDRTDAQIARGQLNSGNYILWFVQADAGTITEEDIKFIRQLRGDIPKLIIVNKADKKNPEDLKEIIEKIRYSLEMKGVRYIDVLAFSNLKPEEIRDKELLQFLRRDKEKLEKQLAEWNTHIYESNFARNFKTIFFRCKKFYEKEIEEEGRKLTRLNTSLTYLADGKIDQEILEPLQLLVKDAQKSVIALKKTASQLKELQDAFFTEIKTVADAVGISMPEPSEIDLMRDRAQDPLQLIEEYLKKQKKGSHPFIQEKLQSTFEEIEPFRTKSAFGKDYESILLETMMERSLIDSRDIQINAPCRTAEKCACLLEGTLCPVEIVQKLMVKRDSEYVFLNAEADGMKAEQKVMYIKVLHMILTCRDSLSELQKFYLTCLAGGFGIENTGAILSGDGAQISEADMRSFIAAFGERKERFYFVLDGILLLQMKDYERDCGIFFSEIVNLIDVDEKEFSYLIRLAKGIIEQDQSIFTVDIEVPERVSQVDFTPYVSSFYVGAVVDTDQEIHYLVFEKEKSSCIDLPRVYEKKRVIFENLVINIKEEFRFKECEEVIFKNCQIFGDADSHQLSLVECKQLSFFECKSVKILHCTFKHFQGRVLVFSSVEDTEIDNCIFEDCICYYNRDHGNWDPLGGVISGGQGRICNSDFKNCGGRNLHRWPSSAIIATGCWKVDHCSFEKCCNYHSKTLPDDIDNRRTLFASGSEDIGHNSISVVPYFEGKYKF